MAKLIDISGRKFYRWTVLEKAESIFRSGARWHVVCDCGSRAIVAGKQLLRGGSKMCVPCSRKYHSIQRRMRLTPQELQSRAEKRRAYWREKGRKRYRQKHGIPADTPLLRGQVVDIRGMRVGAWTVVERVGRRKQRESMWLCRCDCGFEAIQQGSKLRSNGTLSCRTCANRAIAKRRKTATSRQRVVRPPETMDNSIQA